MRQVFREANRPVLRRGKPDDVKKSHLHFWPESVATCVLLVRKHVALGRREVTGDVGDVGGVTKPMVPQSLLSMTDKQS
jgi:hypothetical protein